MKLLTIVGIRKSGKTSTTEALLREIARRGLTAGTCKTIFCPTFSIDKPDSNTARHLKAGSALVCARARQETSFIQPGAMTLSEIAGRYSNFDYLLLEGDYLSPVPRIVCAHKASDALPRINDLTICCAGRIAALEAPGVDMPMFNPLTDAAALLDFIDTHVPDAVISPVLDEPLPPVPGVTGDGFCQCGCHHHEHKQAQTAAKPEGVLVMVDGQAVTLTPEQQAQVRAWAEEKHV